MQYKNCTHLFIFAQNETNLPSFPLLFTTKMLTLASFFKPNRFSGNNGDKVIFHAFFNYGAQSADWNVCTDEDFEGVYDAEAKTITVKASDLAGEDCVKIYNSASNSSQPQVSAM